MDLNDLGIRIGNKTYIAIVSPVLENRDCVIHVIDKENPDKIVLTEKVKVEDIVDGKYTIAKLENKLTKKLKKR